jgi:hypothetical protein
MRHVTTPSQLTLGFQGLLGIAEYKQLPAVLLAEFLTYKGEYIFNFDALVPALA